MGISLLFYVILIFLSYQILEESVISGGKISQYHGDLFSHIFGAPWVRECGCKLRNKRVQKPHCLSPPCPLLFFPSPPRLDVRCFPSHTETYEPVSELRHSTPHLSHKRTHTPRCCGSETQPECRRTLLRYASRRFGEGRAPPINSQNAPLHLRFLLTPRNESRLCSSSSGSHVKNRPNHTYSWFLPPNTGVILFSHRLVTGEQPHGAGRCNQGCTPNQQQTWGITSFTCMRKSALFMKKLLPLPAALLPVVKLSWRWPLQTVAAATIWLQFVYFIILQSRWLQAARCFLPFMLLQPYDMVASFRGSGAVCWFKVWCFHTSQHLFILFNVNKRSRIYVSQYLQPWLRTILVYHSDSTQKWLHFIALKLDIIVRCKGWNINSLILFFLKTGY